MTSTPLICDLGAFDANERVRYGALRALLDSSIRETRELPEGFALRLSGEPPE